MAVVTSRGAPARRWFGWTCLVMLLATWYAPPRVQAQERIGPAQPPWVLEAHGGWNDPLGVFGLAMAYDPGGRFSFGLGIGMEPPSFGLLGRLRIVRAGLLSLGLASALSLGEHRTERTYYPPYGPSANRMTWKWEPGLRASGAVTAELAGRRWSLRLEGGIAYLLNRPTCTYQDETSSYQGDCGSSLIPAPYRFAIQPGRVIPSITAAIGYRLGVKDAVLPNPFATRGVTGVVDPSLYRSPSRALGLSLGFSLASATVGSLLLVGRAPIPGLVMLGVGLTVLPSAGHFYAGEVKHGVLTTASRLVCLGIGGLLVLSAYTSRAVEYPRITENEAWTQAGIGFAFVAGTIALSIYDIVDAPRAARRANARYGLTNLSLAPVLSHGGPASSQGLAVRGRF
jgi:hypothetical protein